MWLAFRKRVILLGSDVSAHSAHKGILWSLREALRRSPPAQSGKNSWFALSELHLQFVVHLEQGAIPNAEMGADRWYSDQFFLALLRYYSAAV